MSRSHCKWIAISLGLVIGLLAICFVFRDRLIAPRLARLFQAVLHQELGLQVAIGRLGGSLLADIEIDDLHTLTPGTWGSVSALTAKRLHVRYSPCALLKGMAAFVDAMRIEAEGLRVELDFGRGDASSPETAPSPPLPLMLPTVHVRDATVAIRWGDLRTGFDGIRLDAEKDAADARRIRLSVAEWSWSHPRLAAGKTTVAAELALTPESIGLQRLDLGGGRVTAHARIARAGPDDSYPFEAQLQLFGEGRISLAGDVSVSSFNARLNADQVELEPIASLFLQSLSGRLSADVDLIVPFERPENTSGRLRLDVFNAKIRGIDVAQAGAAATVAGGWARLAALEAASGRSRLTVTQAAAPFQHLLDGAWGPLLQELSGHFALASQDLPRLLQVTGLAVADPAARIPEHRFELSGHFDAGRLTIPHAGLTSEAGRVLIQNLETRLSPSDQDAPLRGDLRLDLPDLAALSRILPLFSSSGRVRAAATLAGTLDRPEADATLWAENLKIEDLQVGDLSLKVRCERQRVLVKTLAIRRGEDTLNGSGSIRLPTGHIDAAELSFAVADMQWLGAYLLPASWVSGGARPRIQGRARGQARLTGLWSSPDGELAATFEDLGLGAQRFGNGGVRILKQGQRVTADPIELVQGSDRLELRGSYDAAVGQLGRARLQLNAKEIGPYLDALAPQWGGLRGGASAMIEASGPLDQPDFKLDLFVQQIQTAGLSLGDTRIQASGGGRQIRIESAETITPAGRLQAAGRLTRNPAGTVVDAILEDLSLEGSELRLALVQPTRMRYETPRRLSVDRFEAAGPQGRIAVHGELALEGRSDLTVELTGVSGAGWLAPFTGVPLVIEGMDVALRAQGTAAAPEITLTGTVRRLGAEGEPMALAGRFDLAYSAKRLRIDACEWTGSEGSRFALTGVLPIDPAGEPMLGSGALTVAAEARLPGQELLRRLLPAWPVASGSVDAELSLEGTWAAPRGTLRVSGRDLNPADPPRLAPPGPYEVRLEMAIEARRMLFPVVEVRSADAQLQGAGVWQDYPAFSRWVVGRPAAEGTVALEGRLSVPDLGWLARGYHDIRRVAGRLDVDLKLEGPLRDPRLQASMRLTDGELRPEAEMPPLQALSLEAEFTGRDITIRSMRGELGGAPFQLSGSMADILAPDGQRRVDLRLEGQNLLLYRSQTLRARADADLRLAGPPERLVLSGSLSFTDGLFAKNFGLAEGLTAGSAKPKAGPGFSLFSMEAPPLRDMRFDVRIDARRPFQVKNNLVRGAVRPDLSLVGTGEAPELLGKVYLDATTLFLPAGRMQFESGVIHFEAVDPGRPRLDMVGSARMLGYDITAAVEGPYDEPAVSLSAMPPLPDAELLALVLTGQPPKTPGSEPVEKHQGLNVAVFIGRDVLMRMPGGGTESLQTVLERFDVEVGRSVTRAGDETINARFRITDGVLRNGDTLYLTGEKDVFDHYNAGVRIVFRFR